jgi:predicted acylesterase/phospholipase RssA
MVPVMYKNHVGVPCVLRNYATSNEPPVDLTIAEAMLATCSTPPIFTPTIISKDSAKFEYVSGDLGLSNPTREIIAEAHRTFGDETTVSCLLSIGCGHPGVNAVPSESGSTSWIKFLEGVATDSEKTAQDIGTHMSKLSLYHRLSVVYGLERNQAREWKDQESITAHTTTYLNDLSIVDIMDRCVNTIKHGDGFATLEQLSMFSIGSH